MSEPKALINWSGDETGAEVRLAGQMVTRNIALFDKDMRAALTSLKQGGRLTLNAKEVTELDTAGAWMFVRTKRLADEAGVDLAIDGLQPHFHTLIDEVHEDVEGTGDWHREDKPSSLFIALFASVGQVIVSLWQDIIMGLHILGAAVRGSQMKHGHGNKLSLAPIANQIDQMGVKAVPIVVLMSSIVGAIIAQQGAFQLRYFGAEIFVVDLVGILVLRELGVLLTAVMVAGRSGSAITAEIGSMKMREEVDALTVIGLNPVGVLVFPRLVALTISLLLLTFVANLAALAGALFVGWTYSDIPPGQFITRVRDAIELKDLYAGLIKAPFMAIIVGIIASVEGMKVGGSAESLGQGVTASVVKSIFVVIVVDGFFAMFYAAVNF